MFNFYACEGVKFLKNEARLKVINLCTVSREKKNVIPSAAANQRALIASYPISVEFKYPLWYIKNELISLLVPFPRIIISQESSRVRLNNKKLNQNWLL